MNVIKELKNNHRPFGLMSEEMQEKVKEIGIIEFQYWDFGWETCQIRDWADGACYRLRPGYEPEPELELEKYEVCLNAGVETAGVETNEYLYYIRYNEQPLCQAPDDPDFIGFLYEGDSLAYPDSRKYRDGSGCWYTYWKPGFQVLTPTAVLFKK